MIYLTLGVIAALIFCLEVLILKKRSSYQSQVSLVHQLDKDLEIIRALSYLPSSKALTLEEDLKSLAGYFSSQDEYQNFTLVFNRPGKGLEIFRYHQELSPQTSFDIKKDFVLTEDEKALLAELEANTSKDPGFSYQQVMVVPVSQSSRGSMAALKSLNNFKQNLGHLILFSNHNLSKDNLNFIQVVAGVILLLFKKWEFSQALSPSQQVAGVDREW